MGRKRKLLKVKKAENDSTCNEEKHSGKISETGFRLGDIVLVKEKDFPVWWPGRVVEQAENSTTVFIHSDESEFIVQHGNILPFNESIVEKSLETLKRKNLKSSLKAFKSDIYLIGEKTTNGKTDVPITDVSISDVGTTDVPISDVGTTEVPISDVGTTEVPISDVGTTEVPISDVGTTDVPISDVGTTEVPISDVGTTEVPISDVGTTEVPISDVGTTDVPISDVGSTDVPITDVPISDVGTTEVPISDVGTTEVPISGVGTTEVPISDIDTTDVPISDVGSTDVPITDVPISDVGSTDVPITEVPISDVGTTDVPITDVPISDVGTTEVPISDVSTTDVPITDIPISDVGSTDVPISDVDTTDVPISDVGTTEVPISDVGTTEVPISDVGTTEVPISDVGTTEVPISDVDTTDVPISDVGSTDVPITDVPMSDVGTTEVPISDVGSTDVPITDVPISDVGTTEVPISDVGTTDVPISDVGTTDVPISDVGTTDVPISDVHTQEVLTSDFLAFYVLPSEDCPSDIQTSYDSTEVQTVPALAVSTPVVLTPRVSESGVPTSKNSSRVTTSEIEMSEDKPLDNVLVTDVYVEPTTVPFSDAQVLSLRKLLVEDSDDENEEHNTFEENLDNLEHDPDWDFSETVSDSENSESGHSEVYPLLSIKSDHSKCPITVSLQEKQGSVDTQLEGEPSDDMSDESDLDDETVLRDVKNPKLYIRKVMKSDTTKTGKKKRVDRVYNSYQFCGICNTRVSNFAQHIERNQQKHESNSYVKEIQKETDPKMKNKLRTLLRGRFNHDFNMASIKRGRGEIILERRPSLFFNLADFGPCPTCFLWVGKKLMQKHQKTCPARTDDIDTKTSSELLTASDAICKRIQPIASRKLVKEVFGKMKMDKIGQTARNDILIVQLGNQWMEKNIGNKLKRGSYTSEIVRLVGRLLLNLKTVKPLSLGPDGEESSLWDYLKPEHLDAIVEATLLVASPSAEDEDNLKHPSNAIKLGFDIKRVISGKVGLAIIQGDKKGRDEAEDLLRTMNIYWATRVTKLARVLLQQRMYRKSHKLPEPDDIKKLNEYLKAAIADFDLSKKDLENFRRVGELTSARLLLYNRRRPGELQAIGLTDYKERQKGGNVKHLIGDCTAFERKLLENQMVITVRGKTGRGVPIIIPGDAREPMDYLTNEDVRRDAGIMEKNTFVFASKGEGVVRAYDALAKACHDANLLDPKTVTCTNLRKYMATITQVLDLKPNEMEWVISHMGHSLDIHKIHYRCTSDVLEKTQIAKILLLQDHDRVGEFRGKSLQDIQMEDLVQESSSNPVDESEDIHDMDDITSRDTVGSSEPCDFSVLDIAEKFDDEYVPKPVRKRKSAAMTRERWTTEEEEEIKQLFKTQLEKKIRPSPRQCQKAIDRSKLTSGIIWKRKKDVLKKKLFRMVDKLNVGQKP